MTTRATILFGDGDRRHGTVNGYKNLECRCPACTRAWSTYHLAMIKRDRDPLPPGDERHGSPSAYAYWHCRCDICRAGKAERGRKRRAGVR